MLLHPSSGSRFQEQWLISSLKFLKLSRTHVTVPLRGTSSTSLPNFPLQSSGFHLHGTLLQALKLFKSQPLCASRPRSDSCFWCFPPLWYLSVPLFCLFQPPVPHLQLFNYIFFVNITVSWQPPQISLLLCSTTACALRFKLKINEYILFFCLPLVSKLHEDINTCTVNEWMNDR